MKNVFLEVGKGLIIFGNLGAVLLFLREFLTTNNNYYLILATLFLIVFYFVGSILIYFSNQNGE